MLSTSAIPPGVPDARTVYPALGAGTKDLSPSAVYLKKNKKNRELNVRSMRVPTPARPGAETQ